MELDSELGCLRPMRLHGLGCAERLPPKSSSSVACQSAQPDQA